MGKKFFVTKLMLRQGYKIPRGWGIAYRLYDMNASIILPIPINIIVGAIRKFYYSLICGWWVNSKIDIVNERIRDRFFNEGIKKGRELEKVETKETVQETIDEHFRRAEGYIKGKM